jgi:hypothetical protein
MEAVVAAVLLTGAALGGLVAWRLQRRHHGVPRGWSTAQSEAADLHRRLHRAVDETRKTVARVGARGAPVDQLVSLTEDLHAEAITIDRELVAASRLPDGARHKALLELKWRIVESEKLARRVQAIAVDMTGPSFDATDEGIRRLHERLDALDDARREAREIGRDEPTAEPPAS